MEKLKEFRNSAHDERAERFWIENHTAKIDLSEYGIDINDISKKLDRSEYKNRIRLNFKWLDDQND